MHRALCCVRFSVERDYQGKFNCTLEASAFSLLKAIYGSNKSWYKMLGKQSLSDQTNRSNICQKCHDRRHWCSEQIHLLVYRSQIHLHLGDCPRRVVKCDVKGCNNYYALGGKYNHDRQYQESHQVRLKNEVEKLKDKIFNKVHDLRLAVDNESNRLSAPSSYVNV